MKWYNVRMSYLDQKIYLISFDGNEDEFRKWLSNATESGLDPEKIITFWEVDAPYSGQMFLVNV